MPVIVSAQESVPARYAVAVTPSDSVDLTNETRFLYVGVAGDVSVQMAGGANTVLFKAMPVGWHKLQVTRVNSTTGGNTTATNIVALW